MAAAIRITNRDEAIALFTPTFVDRGREQLRVAHLGEDRCLIALRLHDDGGAAAMDFPLGAITQEALLFRSRGLLVAHNHPSGDPSPSRDDIQATRALVRAIAPHDIRLHDHLILGGGDWRSLAALGLF